MSVSFTVPGRVPSKSNYRKDGSKASRDLWRRIVAYEHDVGMAALAAGVRRFRGKGRARLKVLLVNQTLDLDNSLKCPVDGLKHVAFEDDSPSYLEAVQVCWAEDDGPARAEFRIEWEGG